VIEKKRLKKKEIINAINNTLTMQSNVQVKFHPGKFCTVIQYSMMQTTLLNAKYVCEKFTWSRGFPSWEIFIEN